MHLQFAAGHAQPGAGAEALGVEQGLFIELAIPHKGHDVDGGEVAQAVAVEQYLAAGVAAAEVGAALEARHFVDPARLAGVAHLL